MKPIICNTITVDNTHNFDMLFISVAARKFSFSYVGHHLWKLH